MPIPYRPRRKEGKQGKIGAKARAITEDLVDWRGKFMLARCLIATAASEDDGAGRMDQHARTFLDRRRDPTLPFASVGSGEDCASATTRSLERGGEDLRQSLQPQACHAAGLLGWL